MNSFRFASIGSVSTATLRTEDLLSSFISTLEGLLLVNGDFYSRPENFAARDSLNSLIGEAQDCFSSDGDHIRAYAQDVASELVNESLPDALQGFALPYCYFGAHLGDGADFGYWPQDVDEIKEQVDFVSSKAQEEPDASFRGEWLHVNDHGNVTLYVREDNVTDAFARDGAVDREIWSLV